MKMPCRMKILTTWKEKYLTESPGMGKSIIIERSYNDALDLDLTDVNHPGLTESEIQP